MKHREKKALLNVIHEYVPESDFLTGLNAIHRLSAKNIVSRRLTLLSTGTGASGPFIWHKLHLFSYRNGLL